MHKELGMDLNNNIEVTNEKKIYFELTSARRIVITCKVLFTNVKQRYIIKIQVCNFYHTLSWSETSLY